MNGLLAFASGKSRKTAEPFLGLSSSPVAVRRKRGNSSCPRIASPLVRRWGLEWVLLQLWACPLTAPAGTSATHDVHGSYFHRIMYTISLILPVGVCKRQRTWYEPVIFCGWKVGPNGRPLDADWHIVSHPWKHTAGKHEN